MTKSIYLSPSVQEKNRGVGNYGTEEKRMNQIADVTQRELIRHGVLIYRNRPEWTLPQIVVESDFKKPDLHLAIHSNAGGGRGCEVYCYMPGGEGEKAAQAVYEEVAAITPTEDRGIKFTKHFFELYATKSPAILVEVAFHDNTEDALWIMDHIEDIGVAIAKGVLKHFDIPYVKLAELEGIVDRINRSLEMMDLALLSIRKAIK